VPFFGSGMLRLTFADDGRSVLGAILLAMTKL
jgi:hypothetical protein